MAFEVTCGECGGQLLVESGGVVVECPLCHAHLAIPELESEPARIPESISPPPPVVAETTSADSQILARVAGETDALESAIATCAPVTPESPVIETSTPGNPEAPGVETAAPVASAADSASEPDALDENVFSHSQPNLTHFATSAASIEEAPPDQVSQNQASLASESLVESTPEEDPESRHDGKTSIGELSDHGWPTLNTSAPPTIFPESAAAAAVEPQPSSATEASETTGQAGLSPSSSSSDPGDSSAGAAFHPSDFVPRQHFILVAGYASAATLVLLYLIFFGLRSSRTHQLESLPDLVPKIRQDGAVGFPRVLPNWDVAPGHELKLGETQRFGNVQVTPIKITRSPIQFEHVYGTKGAAREPTKPVFKLWLKFENVSKSQEFPVLDRPLVYRRIYDKQLQSELALAFLCRADQRVPPDGERYFVYDMPEFSEFNLKGQDLNHWLKPGDVWETYIPADESLAKIQGHWVWRVLFRKGLNPESGRGVTTLIDVHFDGSDVIAES